MSTSLTTETVISTPKEKGRRRSSSLRGVLFGLTGIGVLGSLMWGVPLQEVLEVMDSIGISIALVFLVAPLWFVANAASLRQLLGSGNGVPSHQLVVTQIVGDGLSALLPLAGVGGEPFKLGHLSQWASVPRVSVALLHDRLVHVVSGLLYLATLMAASAWWLDLSSPLEWGLVLGAVALVVAGAGLMALATSALPSGLSWLSERVSMVRNIRTSDIRVERRDLLVALGYKMVARFAHLPELWLIAVLMGLSGDPGQVALIGTMLTGSTFLFFVVPGGIGVNEAGVAGAFTLLGLSAHLGVAFGLIRRARVLFWAFIGLGLWTGGSVFSRLLSSLRPSDLCPSASMGTAPEDHL